MTTPSRPRRLLLVVVIAAFAASTLGCSRRLARTAIDIGVRVAVNALAHHASQEHASRRQRAYELPPPPIDDSEWDAPVVKSSQAPLPRNVLAPAAPDAVNQAAQDAVRAIDVSSCSEREAWSGRAKIVLDASGRAVDVLVEDAPPEVRACVRLRLRGVEGIETDGQRVTVSVDWTTRRQVGQPGGV